MFRIATILIILSVAGSEVNCGTWLKGLNCFSTRCHSMDGDLGSSEDSPLILDADRRSSSSSVDTKIDSVEELAKSGIITLKVDVLYGYCKTINKFKPVSDFLYKHRVDKCLDEIVKEIDNYRSSSVDNEMLEVAFKDIAVFDSLYDNEVLSGKEMGFGDLLGIRQPRGSKLEADCLRGELDINDDFWLSIKKHVPKEIGLDGEKTMRGLFGNTCDLIDKEKPLKDLLVAGKEFLIESRRLRENESPKESQCNVRLIRHMLCTRVKEWHHDQKRGDTMQVASMAQSDKESGS